jgi:hypothetical protein
LVREWSKTVTELYENFVKFSKSEILYFRKLEQQRKVRKHDEASRPTRYSENRPHNSYPKDVNNINFDGCGPLENWEKNFEPPPQERKERAFDHRTNHYSQRGGMSSRGRGRGRSSFKPQYCM